MAYRVPDLMLPGPPATLLIMTTEAPPDAFSKGYASCSSQTQASVLRAWTLFCPWCQILPGSASIQYASYRGRACPTLYGFKAWLPRLLQTIHSSVQQFHYVQSQPSSCPAVAAHGAAPEAARGSPCLAESEHAALVQIEHCVVVLL